MGTVVGIAVAVVGTVAAVVGTAVASVVGLVGTASAGTRQERQDTDSSPGC